MASWVQAIGSIAAIGGALWIAANQHRLASLQRAEEEVQKGQLRKREEERLRQYPLFTLRAILDRANYLVTRMPKDVPSAVYVEHYFFYEASPPSFEGVQRALTGFPIDKLVDDMAIRALFSMQDAVYRAGEALKRIISDRENWVDSWGADIPEIAEAHSNAELAMAYLQGILVGAGIAE